MIRHKVALLAAALAATGCTEGSGPTSAVLEQAVFTALGGLRVGEVLSLSGSEAGTIFLGGSATAGEFVYIPFHASESRGSSLVVNVSGENVSSAGINPALAPTRARSPFQLNPLTTPSTELHQRLHARLQRSAQEHLHSHRPTFQLRPGDGIGVRSDLSGNNAAVGMVVQINTSVAPGFCTSVDNRTGRVEAITQRAIVVGDIANPANGFTRADYESFGAEFDDLVHPTITRFFAEPTDIDENGKVIIFFTRAVNELTTDATEGFVGGFFYARDLFPATGADACPASNEGEIFYVLAPDPNAVASPIEHTRDEVFNDAVGTIGHEYQHLINAGRRIWINGASALEDSWLDEGLAHIGEELLFYAAANVEPKDNIGVADLDRPGLRDAINRFMVQNLSRYGLYLEEVTTESPTNIDDSLETRGAAWAFLRYTADHSEFTNELFFSQLVDTPLVGHDNIKHVLDGESLDWFQRWGVSVFTDDFMDEELDPLWQEPSWNFRSLLPRLFTDFPLDVEKLNSGTPLRLDIRSTSSGYVRFGGEAGERSKLTTTSAGQNIPSTLRVTVIRTE
jgi:hypothetical protein